MRSAFRIVFELHLQRFDIDTVLRTSGSVSAGSREDRNQADITRSGWFGQRTVRFPHEGRKARAQTNWRAFPDRARRSAFEGVLESCPGDRPPGAAKDLVDL